MSRTELSANENYTLAGYKRPGPRGKLIPGSPKDVDNNPEVKCRACNDRSDWLIGTSGFDDQSTDA